MGVVQLGVGGLAEEVGQQAWFPQLRLWFQFVDNATEEHRVTLAGVSLDPEQSCVFVVAPSREVVMVEDPAVRLL